MKEEYAEIKRDFKFWSARISMEKGNSKSAFGAIAGGLCLAYDAYSYHQTLKDISNYQQQIKGLKSQIKSLDLEKDCDKVLELEQQAYKISLQLAASQAAGNAQAVATTILCAGLLKL